MARTWPFNTSNALTWTKGAHSTALDQVGNASFSICFWVWFNGHITTEQAIISRYNGSLGNLIRLNTASKISFFGINASLAGIDALSNTTLSTGQWYHVACTYDNANNPRPALVYLNGVVGTAANYGAIGINSGGSNTWNFGRREAPSFPLDARLCEVSFWNKTIPAREVLALSHGASPIQMPNGLQGYWPIWSSNDSGVYYYRGTDQDITKTTLVGSLATANHAPVGKHVAFVG